MSSCSVYQIQVRCIMELHHHYIITVVPSQVPWQLQGQKRGSSFHLWARSWLISAPPEPGWREGESHLVRCALPGIERERERERENIKNYSVHMCPQKEFILSFTCTHFLPNQTHYHTKLSIHCHFTYWCILCTMLCTLPWVALVYTHWVCCTWSRRGRGRGEPQCCGSCKTYEDSSHTGGNEWRIENGNGSLMNSVNLETTVL